MPLLLGPEDYRKTPWKNGNGVTEDILLLPHGSSHDDFDIRISRAPIVDDSRFSAFAGIDRTITLLGENPLSLRFDDHEEKLAYLVPYSFDSALAPRSLLASGPSQVMNVMTRRGQWQSQVSVLQGSATRAKTVQHSDILVIHVSHGKCDVSGSHVGNGQTLILDGPATIEMELPDRTSCLVAMLSPVAGR